MSWIIYFRVTVNSHKAPRNLRSELIYYRNSVNTLVPRLGQRMLFIPSIG